jgi:hypothetical protein
LLKVFYTPYNLTKEAMLAVLVSREVKWLTDAWAYPVDRFGMSLQRYPEIMSQNSAQ